MKMNGIATGNVDTNTRRKTPSAPSQSSLCSRACAGGSGSCFNRWCIVSSSAGSRTDATTDGNASAIRRRAWFGSVAWRTARNVRSPVPFSDRLPIRYSTASMMPQARLHPSAPMSMVRTSARSASATLSEPVKVRTMINPKSTSAMRSLGSSTRLVDLMGSSGMRVMIWVNGLFPEFTALGAATDTASWQRSNTPSAPGPR